MKICKRGVWDETVPGITFDEEGNSNFSKIHDALVANFPRGEEGARRWEQSIEEIRKSGKGKRYDCIIGVSGGTDSSYLMHIAKEKGLRPLAVNLDNGWSSDISVKNIKIVTSRLGIDLETYVIDYEEIKDYLRAYMRACMPWIDTPTDIAIKASLYKIADREGIKYILRGNDFRSEGKQPREWTYSDSRQFAYILKTFGTLRMKTFPNLTARDLVYYGIFRGIKEIRPFYFIEYQKKEAQEFLIKNYGWEYYGGHHHENIFTKFAISYWLPRKFGIDKRKITLSAQVLSGEITRDQALETLQKPFYDLEQMERDKDYVIKKLDITPEEFQRIWNSPNKYFTDYPNYYAMMSRMVKWLNPVLKLIYTSRPMTFIEMEHREKSKAYTKPGSHS